MGKNRNWRRIESERGSVFLEYALITSMLTIVAIAVFTPAFEDLTGGQLWAGSNFGNDYLIRDALFKLPFF